MLSVIFSISTLYFFIISLVNVILSSTKSICTVRYGRSINVIMNVISYSFYVIVVKQTAALPLPATVLATAVANALGVWLSYAMLDKIQKDRLWKFEVVIKNCVVEEFHKVLTHIPHNYIEIGPKTIFNFYCSTREESAEVLKFSKLYHGKIFAVENKL